MDENTFSPYIVRNLETLKIIGEWALLENALKKAQEISNGDDFTLYGVWDNSGSVHYLRFMFYSGLPIELSPLLADLIKTRTKS